jgi:hypothetical protein
MRISLVRSLKFAWEVGTMEEYPLTRMQVSKTEWPLCTMWSSSGTVMAATSVVMPPKALEYIDRKLLNL